MKRGIGWLIAGGVVLALVAAGAWAIEARRAALAQAPEFAAKPIAIHTAAAQAGRLDRARSYLATVDPQRSARITAEVTAAVTDVPVDEGTKVAAGDVLVRLNASEVDARLAANKAEIARARADRAAERANLDALEDTVSYWREELERDRRLSDQNVVSRSKAAETANQLNEAIGRRNAARRRVKALKSAIEALEAQRQELQAQQADHVLTAPFAGEVTARAVDPGDQAAPGKMLVELQTTDRLRLRFEAPQDDLAELAQGQTVRFGEGCSTRISRVHPALDGARLARVEADLPAETAASGNGCAPASGAWTEVTVATGESDRVSLIPATALAGRDGSEATVYAVADGRAHARKVTVVGRRGERVGVTGIEPGTRVAILPYPAWTRLSDGRRVTVLSR